MALIVGAAGYIGSRLVEDLRFRGQRPRTLDLDIYGCAKALRVRVGDAADLRPNQLRREVVVYLPAFSTTERTDLQARVQYRNLMVDIPLKIAEHCRHLIYVSSMRAVGGEGLYAETKRHAEIELLSFPVTIIRPGTVWGTLKAGWPNRTDTAVNYALTRGKFEGHEWRSYTTHLPKLVREIVRSIGMRPESEIRNVTDRGKISAQGVRALLCGEFPDRDLQWAFAAESALCAGLDLEAADEAKERLKNVYGLL